jgi:uncharacterized protein
MLYLFLLWNEAKGVEYGARCVTRLSVVPTNNEMNAKSMGPKPGPLYAFFLVAFALSWLVWIPAALASHDRLPLQLPLEATGLLGAFGPSGAAVLVTGVVAGTAGIKRLFCRILYWRLESRWYLFAIFWPALLSLAATLVIRVFGRPFPDFTHPPIAEFTSLPPELDGVGFWPLLPFIFLQNLLIGSAMGEELGWRGFALPRLQALMSPLSASLVLGILWGSWHLPLYVTAGHPIADMFFGWLLLNILADAVLFTWLFNNTRGSLLPVLLLHASIATTGLFLASATGSFAVALVLKWGVVCWIVLRSNLSGHELQRGALDG